MAEKTIETKPAEEMTKAEAPRQGKTYVPAVDIVEGFEEIRLFANMPGVLQEDIEVTYERDVLKIDARVRETDPNPGTYLRREFVPGHYERTFRIGNTIDRNGVAATYAHGVLTIRLPKADALKPRTIPVLGE